MENADNSNVTLVECVRRTLTDILGGSGMQAILYHIEKGFGLKIDDIPDNPSRFISALEYTFGLGATVIENATLNEIRSSRTLSEYSDFAEILKIARDKDLSGYKAGYLSKPNRWREQYAKEWASLILQEIQASIDTILDKRRYSEEDYLTMELDESSPKTEAVKIRNFS